MPLFLSPEKYEPYIGQVFTLERINETPVDLKLSGVARGINDDVQQIFYVSFEGPEPLLPQGMFRLKHAAFESFELFLVPSARTKTGYRYDATFNVLKNP